jgi:ATP-dependent DNA helicase PIF1
MNINNVAVSSLEANYKQVNYKQTNYKQTLALDIMKSGANVFITGGAGVGKSYIIRQFIDSYIKDINNIVEKIKSNKGQSNKIAITSTTGVSAVLIGGKTLHSWAGIGLGDGDLVEKVRNNYTASKRWKLIKTLIIDEISMLNPRLFERLDKVAKAIRKSDKPFGGIQLILVGDFCQLPVVKGNGTFCFDTKIWEECDFEIINLTTVIRQENYKFAKLLQDIRLGNISKETKKLLLSRTGIWTKETCNKDGIKPTLLYSTNKNVDELNNKELNSLIELGMKHIKYKLKSNVQRSSLGMVELNNLIEYQTKDIKTINIAVGAQVMLTKNLDVERGLANGSRGIVTGFNYEENNCPIVKFINGIEETITPYKSIYIDSDNKIIFTQIPLKLAWATTIHKSQGATLDYVVANLSNIFEYGQAYVALSRAKNINNLYLTGINFKRINCHPTAKSFYETLEANCIF